MTGQHRQLGRPPFSKGVLTMQLGPSEPLDPRALRDAFGSFATGVTVVTLCDDQQNPIGVTVGSFTSLSLDPALCLFSLKKNSNTAQWIDQKPNFVVNILGRDQEPLAWQFARSADEKFAGIAWQAGANGMPVIEGCLGHFECQRWAVYDGGDHMIVVGQITAMTRHPGLPLVFFRGQMGGFSG
jgi:3-hydroxy-9,10-secoandrosta-1,3,5(10)-triene-9,17-dione monooxygenase reductase component